MKTWQKIYKGIHWAFILTLLWCFSLHNLTAQERIVDDAAITNYRSFQIETWYGQFESVFMPAIGANEWLEIGTGLIFDSENQLRFNGFMPEIKVINNDYEVNGSSLGVVMGMVFDSEVNFSELYLYIPYSRLLLEEKLILHLNAGLNYIPSNTEKINAIYGMRCDIPLYNRWGLITGVFAENLDFSFYGGARYQLIPELIELIATFGQGFSPVFKTPGFAVQLTFTPDQLW